MIGSPGEQPQDIERTMNFIQQLKPDYIQCSITTPYPGTQLYRDAVANGMIRSDLWREFACAPTREFVSPVLSEYFSWSELKGYISRTYRKFYLSAGFLRKEIHAPLSYKEFLYKVAAAASLL